MMIGDGLNDVLSLQSADVGVSINAKSELNLHAADVVLLNENLWRLPTLFKLAKWTRFLIFANISWAICYNVFMLPLAAGLYSF
jgi:P-type E1-E2 ATPase